MILTSDVAIIMGFVFYSFIFWLKSQRGDKSPRWQRNFVTLQEGQECILEINLHRTDHALINQVASDRIEQFEVDATA